MSNRATVVGAGLAGCEAAYQLAKRGIQVDLYEMKPDKKTPAHSYNGFAELVCSNSLRANSLSNAVGLLKEEMRRLDSLIIKCADENRVPAGGALAVDRTKFSNAVTKAITNHPSITVKSCEITKVPEDKNVIIATGPLTSKALSDSIGEYLGGEYLHFFDAAAPIVTLDSIDTDIAFFASRYDKGTPDYINCPMTQEQYNSFYNELINAECAELHGFENNNVFEGCMPVEVMAKRGPQTLLFGPLKPVGLIDKRTEKRSYAVVQLRKDNTDGTLYNMVGFQTHLKFPEQKRVFSMIPGLQNAEFVRYGVMHRNTFINSPQALTKFYSCKKRNDLFFAGQITGVEGYVESASSGLSAGINLARTMTGKAPIDFTKFTATGALASYISEGSCGAFQPMNVNFGIIEPLDIRIKVKSKRYEAISARALDRLNKIIGEL